MPWIMKRWWMWNYLFSRFQWYRRWCGGHWEYWWNDATRSWMWFQVDQCSDDCNYRPPCCLGYPRCEDH